MGDKRNVTTMAVSILPELLDQIDKAAGEDRRSRSQWVVMACEEKLNKNHIADTAEIPAEGSTGVS